MLGDRQGWMIEELMPRLGPRDQIGVQPCIAYLANLSREHVSRIQRTGSMPRAIETTPAKNERPSPGRRYWPQIATAVIPVAGLSRQPFSRRS